MHVARLRKVGGSLMVAVPSAFLDQLQLTKGSSVTVAIENGRLIMSSTRPKYTHAELLAMGPPPKKTAEDIAWEAAPAAGSEII